MQTFSKWFCEPLSKDICAEIVCGQGDFYGYERFLFAHYIGIDAVRYEDFPEQAEFCRLDLDSGVLPLADCSADVVAAIEVIEHLENPREFMQKLVRWAKPGGWVIVTTPNQLSWLSLVTLVLKHRVQAFQDVHYPAHLTALLEVDLRRVAAEAGLAKIEIEYSHSGRISGIARHYPKLLSPWFLRASSENVLVIGQKLSG